MPRTLTPVDTFQGALDVVELEAHRTGDHLARLAFPDALGRRPQAMGQLVLDLLLQLGEPAEAELHGEPDDGGATGVGPAGDVGDRSEGDRLRMRQHDVGDATFGGRQFVAAFVDASGDHGGTDVTIGS
jgi:hypothetical protein